MIFFLTSMKDEAPWDSNIRGNDGVDRTVYLLMVPLS